MSLLDLGIVCVIAAFSATLAVIVAVWLSRRRVEELRVTMATKIGHLEAMVIEMQQRREVRPAAVQTAGPRPASIVTRRDVDVSGHASGTLQGQGMVAPVLSAEATREQFSQAASAALEGQQSFRDFATGSGGSGFMLRPGAEEAEPAAGPNPETAADLWVVDDGQSRLVYPGYNLRRGQSALVSDAGRLARERLEWLFEIVPGAQLGAMHPARIGPHDWTVIERGVLTVPLRVG